MGENSPARPLHPCQISGRTLNFFFFFFSLSLGASCSDFLLLLLTLSSVYLLLPCLPFSHATSPHWALALVFMLIKYHSHEIAEQSNFIEGLD